MTEAVLADRRRPGPTRSLSRAQVVAAGLEVMARDGLSSVSLRAVAQHLGVDHKTLYTYVSDKDDLLAGMFDAALTELDLPLADDPRTPADQLVDLFVSIRRVLLANVDLFRLTRPNKVVGTGWGPGDRILATLAALVPDAARSAELFANLTQLAVGSALESEQAGETGRDLVAQARKVDPADHPLYHGFVRAWTELDREQAFVRLVRDVLRLAASG